MEPIEEGVVGYTVAQSIQTTLVPHARAKLRDTKMQQRMLMPKMEAPVEDEDTVVTA